MSDSVVMRLAFILGLILHLLPAAAFAGDLWISNHTDFPGRKIVMDLVGRTNYTYDAKGTTLTVREPAIALHLKGCRNVTIRNLTIDWERPVLTEARVVGFSDGETRIRIDTSRYPVAVEEGRLLVVGPGRRERIRAVRFLSGRTGAPVPLTADTSFRETRAREEADGTIVLAADYSHEGTGLAVGDILVFRPFERPYPAVFIEDSSGVLLEDVIIRDAYGMGVVAQMSEDIVWRGTGRAADKTSGVIAREGSHVTTHADASHFSNCRGQVTVENCWFEGMMDDAINVHSTCVQITNILSRSSVRCVFRHPEAIGFTLFRSGDRARLIRSRTNEDGPVLTVAAVRRVSDEVVELDFGTDLPADFGVGDTVENADYQCAATFRGNVVRNNRARGVLFTTPGKVICSSNRFERCCGSAVVLASDAAYWFESGHCRDVEIAGNVISNCLTAGYGRHGSAFGVISIDPIVRELDAQRDYCHSNIRIVDNEIFTFDATLLFARSAKDILWRNNVVRYNDDFRGWGKPPFVFERVTGFRNEPAETAGGFTFIGRDIGPRCPLPDVPSTRALVPELTLHPVRTNGTEWTYPLRRLKTPTDGTGRPKPFLLNLRPRLAERPHLVLFDKVVVDRADYAKWCSEHPEYLGMQTLEWVHDAQTPYSPEWLARHRQGTPFAVTEDEVREALGRDEYRHGREDRHQFSTNLLRSAYNRIVELSFGDAKRLFIGDGTYCTDHLVADWGAGGLAFETTRNYYFWQIQMMFTRGAAVQYGIPFRWYIASFFNDGNQTADTPETGLSVSAVKRVSYLSYFSGAASYQREAGVELAYCYRRNPDASRNGTFGPEGLVYDEFYRFCTRHPRGEPYRAAALVVPIHRGYTRQGGAAYRGLFPYSREDHLLDAIMSVILDFPKNKDRRALKRHAERVMANSRYGDVFDVLCPDGERREFFRKALPRYRVAFVIGDSDSETDDALAAFERQGGRVVRMSADLVPWDGDDERFRQAALARVGCDRVMDFSQPVRFPGIERIMDDRVLPLLPFDVRGDVQFGFNRVQDGWIVYLINNAGVFKPAVGLASFDAAGSDVVIGLKGRKPSRIRLLGADCDRDLFAVGDGIGLNVPSGDVRVVHIAEGDPKCEMR